MPARLGAGAFNEITGEEVKVCLIHSIKAQRPFIWHIWDGKKDGFAALVNYHKLASPQGKKVLESLPYGYLGDWIIRQEAAVKNNEFGADDRLLAAKELQEQLEAILHGEPPYDIFVRWKPLHEQPIGWAPDINDGVRMNIRPFMLAELSRGRRGAGVLRYPPKSSGPRIAARNPIAHPRTFHGSGVGTKTPTTPLTSAGATHSPVTAGTTSTTPTRSSSRPEKPGRARRRNHEQGLNKFRRRPAEHPEQQLRSR